MGDGLENDILKALKDFNDNVAELLLKQSLSGKPELSKDDINRVRENIENLKKQDVEEEKSDESDDSSTKTTQEEVQKQEELKEKMQKLNNTEKSLTKIKKAISFRKAWQWLNAVLEKNAEGYISRKDRNKRKDDIRAQYEEKLKQLDGEYESEKQEYLLQRSLEEAKELAAIAEQNSYINKGKEVKTSSAYKEYRSRRDGLNDEINEQYRITMQEPTLRNIKLLEQKLNEKCQLKRQNPLAEFKGFIEQAKLKQEEALKNIDRLQKSWEECIKKQNNTRNEILMNRDKEIKAIDKQQGIIKRALGFTSNIIVNIRNKIMR